jgi:hypothetical protein
MIKWGWVLVLSIAFKSNNFSFRLLISLPSGPWFQYFILFSNVWFSQTSLHQENLVKFTTRKFSQINITHHIPMDNKPLSPRSWSPTPATLSQLEPIYTKMFKWSCCLRCCCCRPHVTKIYHYVHIRCHSACDLIVLSHEFIGPTIQIVLSNVYITKWNYSISTIF